jgi:hypothetical protein
MPLSCPSRSRTSSFTLLEVLITLALLVVILLLLGQAVDSADRAWKEGAADPFADAQDAFETLAGDLAQATLETYDDYADANGNFRTNALFTPDHLARRSDLAFACGPAAGTSGLLAASQRTTVGSAVFFTAPEGFTQTYANHGLEHLLNDMGFLVEFGDDNSGVALFGLHRYRWRLREIEQPSESLQVYALIVLPERNASDSGAVLAPAYRYDSRDASNPVTIHQLPPRLLLALVAIDSATADRLAAQNGANAPQLVPATLFQQGTPAQLTQDLATLDAALNAQKIGHRLFQREIQLPASAWSNTTTP